MTTTTEATKPSAIIELLETLADSRHDEYAALLARARAELEALRQLERAARDWGAMRRRESEAAAHGSGRSGSGAAPSGPPALRVERIAAESALFDALDGPPRFR